MINELGSEKCIGVVTDNASNMTAAWKIIEQTFTTIHCNGCASHVMNLLIRDICETDTYKPLMANIQLVCLFVKSRQHVLAKFNDLRKTYHIARSLKLTVPTRWSSHYHSVNNLLGARYALMDLVKDQPLMEKSKSSKPQKVEHFMNLINSVEFWEQCQQIKDVLLHPTNLINVFERHNRS